MLKLSKVAKPLQQSGIRAASTKCHEISGINLGQGICDIAIVDPIKLAAKHAIEQDKSTYSACEGAYKLREALAAKIKSFNKIDISAEHELMVSHGATGAFVCAVQTLFNPGDEVILFEPFYGYHKNILNLMQINVSAVPISLSDFSIDMDYLESVITKKTRGIVVCTPNNPTGKVFSRAELQAIGDFANKHDLTIITDEIYEYITYPGFEHVSIASLSDELKQRTLTISGFSKTFNMTGWRLGYVSGPKHIIAKMSLMQDLYYVCPVTPLQYAGIAALSMPENYYQNMQQAFLKKRQLTVNALQCMGLKFSVPEGAYYILADCKALSIGNGQQTVDYLLDKAKVATVAGASFYNAPETGTNSIRFCYALDESVLSKAFKQMQTVLKEVK